MSILTEPFFKAVEHLFNVIMDKNSGRGDKEPRPRIEIKRTQSQALYDTMLKFQMPCVSCSKPIHPFRPRASARGRNKASGMYYAPACPNNVSPGCSRGNAAHDEYEAIRAYFGK